MQPGVLGQGLNLITHHRESAIGTGAKRKIYALTASGERVLAAYLQGPLAYVNSKLFRTSVKFHWVGVADHHSHAGLQVPALATSAPC